MAEQQTARGNTPPYVPFPSFKTFISDLHDHGLPSRIDRSVLKRFSGVTGTQLMTSARFLKLIDGQGAPTQALAELADAYGTDKWAAQLYSLLKATYAAMFELELDMATASHFDETFRKAFPGADSVIQKNISFFLAAAKDAGVKISDRVLNGRKARSPSAAKKPRAAKAASSVRKPPKDPEKQDEEKEEKGPPKGDFRTVLLAKFPPFDPGWTDELKAKWFDGYERLLQMGDKTSGQPETK